MIEGITTSGWGRGCRRERVGFCALVALVVVLVGCGQVGGEVIAGQQEPVVTSPAPEDVTTTTVESSTTTAVESSTTMTVESPATTVLEGDDVVEVARPGVEAAVAAWAYDAGFADCLLVEAADRYDGGQLEFALHMLVAVDPSDEQVQSLMDLTGVDVGEQVEVYFGLSSAWRSCRATASPDSGSPVTEPPGGPFGYPIGS